MANNFKIDCNSSLGNTGLSKYCQDIGTIAGYIKAPWNAELDTEALAKIIVTLVVVALVPSLILGFSTVKVSIFIPWNLTPSELTP